MSGTGSSRTITISAATQSAAGSMSAADKTKLDGIAAGAEVNQNAFSNVVVNSTTIAADSKTDTLTITEGANVILTPNATGDSIEIEAVDTTYESKAAASGGTAVSLVTTGEKYIWNNKASSDTKNTAGSTDSSSKLFLIGATSQAANPQTYSQDTVYAGTDGHVYSNGKQAVNLSDTQALTNKTYNGYTLGAACEKGVATSISGGGSTADVPTTSAVSGAIFNQIDSYKYWNTNPALTASNGLCTWTVNHGLDSSAVVVQLYEVSTGNQVMADISVVDANNLTVKIISSSNISAGTYRICIESTFTP